MIRHPAPGQFQRFLACYLCKISIILIAIYAYPTRTNSQINALKSCISPSQVVSADLHGLWRAQFDGLAQGATLLLERHTELADSLQGGVNRDGQKTQAAGDIDQGVFSLEESADGKTVSATWQGELVHASCGQEIRGIWTPAQGEARRFVLRKQGGW